MLYACDHCHFLFSRTTPQEQCPDCGKYTIRPASETEQAEFAARLAERSSVNALDKDRDDSN